MDRLRVLVIDDSLTIRAMIEQIVNAEPGCRVVGIAPDVETARQMLIDLVPNVVTLDLALPGTGGIAFLDELSKTVHAPVVVVSSSTQGGSAGAAEAIAHGADACFDKGRMVSDAAAFLRVLKRAAKRKAPGDPSPHTPRPVGE